MSSKIPSHPPLPTSQTVMRYNATRYDGWQFLIVAVLCIGEILASYIVPHISHFGSTKLSSLYALVGESILTGFTYIHLREKNGKKAASEITAWLVAAFVFGTGGYYVGEYLNPAFGGILGISLGAMALSRLYHKAHQAMDETYALEQYVKARNRKDHDRIHRDILPVYPHFQNMERELVEAYQNVTKLEDDICHFEFLIKTSQEVDEISRSRATIPAFKKERDKNLEKIDKILSTHPYFIHLENEEGVALRTLFGQVQCAKKIGLSDTKETKLTQFANEYGNTPPPLDPVEEVRLFFALHRAISQFENNWEAQRLILAIRRNYPHLMQLTSPEFPVPATGRIIINDEPIIAKEKEILSPELGAYDDRS